MDIGMIGLGRMGGNMAQRLLRGGHRVVGFARTAETRKDIEDKGAESAESLAALVAKLPAPRALWLMVPAGEVTDATLAELLPLLAAGDTVVDGGNSNYKDTMRQWYLRTEEHRLRRLRRERWWGSGRGLQPDDRRRREGSRTAASDLRNACTGRIKAGDAWVGRRRPLHEDDPQRHRIRADAGLPEGFSILQHKTAFNLDLHQIAEIWRSGSVVRSWLLDLTADALRKNPAMTGIAPRSPIPAKALDGRRGHRARRASAGDHAFADPALALARHAVVLRQIAGRNAQ
jgi:6-phosphogluconate dehydrogenase